MTVSRAGGSPSLTSAERPDLTSGTFQVPGTAPGIEHVVVNKRHLSSRSKVSVGERDVDPAGTQLIYVLAGTRTGEQRGHLISVHFT